MRQKVKKYVSILPERKGKIILEILNFSTLNNSDFPINCSLPSLKLHNLTISSLSSADPSVFNA